MKVDNMYDVIVIGAGHAGCEATIASAKNGAKTLIITINMDSIAMMPCNSAVGGPGRGQLVREIDVLGGEIAKNADKNFIHSRMLNTSRGPAVQALRAIVDKRRYFLSMKYVLEEKKLLDLKQGLVVDINKEADGYKVITSDDKCYRCKCIVIATGTFLDGKIFWGNYEINAGRQGEIPSNRLAINLKKMGFKFGRLKTETPPKVDKKTINKKILKIQSYDKFPEMFSYENRYDGREQLENYISYVDKECIEYIMKNIKKSANYSHKMGSEGPKYCPSIEDKVKRFKNKKRHLVFIQPEGRDTNEMYLHGLHTTFSEEIQLGIIKRIKGLENAKITRPGYGVEYDYLMPFQINNNLESKLYENIFYAGQVNGTTGYEEAASQGIIAGINAARRAKSLDNIIINREDCYIGVLIDDIVVKGVHEPYRMLTSRNEYRLYHRHDNADARMAKFLKKLGFKEKASKICKKYKKIESVIEEIKKSKSLKDKNLIEGIKQDKIKLSEINNIKNTFNLDDVGIRSVLINMKYKTFIDREINNINKVRSNINVKIPEDIDYSKVNNISNEATKSLKIKKPTTLGQATRIEGVGPADVFSLLCYIKNVSRET